MPILHLVSHTHWDREWYLPLQVFRLKLVQLMDRLLALLATDPEYRYFMLDGQTIVLDDYLQLRPEREAEVCAHVRSGRLLIGPWHILPDEFLVSPEATVRNLLQGQRTAGRFGPRMNVGYIPDPFGHIGQMPQVLRGFGIATAALSRGMAEEPCEVTWQAPDGSHVLLAYLRDGYDNAAPLPLLSPQDVEPFLAGVRRLRDSLVSHTGTEQVLLMHGTDHMEAQPYTSAALAYAQGRLDGDTLVHSTLPAYLEAVQEDLRRRQVVPPTVAGELRQSKRHHLLPGVLSTRMWLKQRNHACETLLEKWAEPFTVWAAWGEPPADLEPAGGFAAILRQAWRMLMECHPHDSICGCSIDQVHEEMRTRFDQVEQIGEEIARQSLAAIAATADTRAPAPTGEWSRAVVVFNPLPGARTDAVTVQLEVPPSVREVAVLDEAGQVLPHAVVGVESQELNYRILDRDGLPALLESAANGQVSGRAIVGLGVQREGTTLRLEATLSEDGEPDEAALAVAWAQLQGVLSDRTVQQFIVRAATRTATIEFVAPEVPGCGYRTFWVGNSLPPGPALPRRGRGGGTEAREEVENEYLVVQASPTGGTLTISDKRTGAVFAGLNRITDGGDCGDEYNYCPPPEDLLVTEQHLQGLTIRAGQEGAGQRLEVTCTLPVPVGLSENRRRRSNDTAPLSIRSAATVWPGVPRVDVVTEVHNPVRDHRLRVHFPVPFAVSVAAYDGHFQVVHRPVGLPAYDESWAEQPRPEVPQRAFADVSDGTVGLMLANYGLPEVAVLTEGDRSEIALTLLRCVGWLSRGDFLARRGHAGPALPTPGAQEVGWHRFRYAMIPHRGGWEEAFQEAYSFNVPLRAVATSVHPGPRPAAALLLRVEPAQFVLSAVKAAEDGTGVIVRGYNITPEPLQVTLALGPRFARAARVRLDETEETELPIADDGRVSLQARGHEIVTVKFY